jgi:hypothetical protein
MIDTGYVASGEITETAPDSLWVRLAERHATATAEEALLRSCREFVSRHANGQFPLRFGGLLAAAGARREARRLTTDGRLELDPSGAFVVVVDRDAHWTRQRFTCAHELAHILLFAEFVDDQRALKRLRSPEESPQVERVCNAAAAEMLMPTHDMAAAIRQSGLGPVGLSQLQARYAVSWSALLVRLTEVLSAPLAVFRRHARHQSEPVAWRVHRMYGATHGIWLPSGLTTSHLDPDIVEEAARHGIGYAAALTVERSGPPTTVLGWAASLNVARAVPQQHALFAQPQHEEASRWPEVGLLLLRPREWHQQLVALSLAGAGLERQKPAPLSDAPSAADRPWQPLTLWD